MTVPYRDGSFLKLLFKWKGSIWCSVWKELLIFLCAYYVINIGYRFGMDDDMQTRFEKGVLYVDNKIGTIPIQFLLGFFVAYLVGRWWDQMLCIAYPDKLLLMISANLSGNDDETIEIRRTFARWCNLLSVLVWRNVSLKIKKRFPQEKHILQSGLITAEEYSVFQATTSTHGRWFVPVSWMLNLLGKCKRSEKVTEFGFQAIQQEIFAYRGNFGMLTVYDWINAPLVYTQVATIACYGYFVLCLFGRQMLLNSDGSHRGHEIDIYFPVFTLLEFLFYVGWLKVAEKYRVPFGEDDDDFDMNYILDRNIHVGFMIVDELSRQDVGVVRDDYWGNYYPLVNHTVASNKVRDPVPTWRLGNVQFNEKDMQIHHENHIILQEMNGTADTIKLETMEPSQSDSTVKRMSRLLTPIKNVGTVEPTNMSL